jgi:hypothetical protein
MTSSKKIVSKIGAIFCRKILQKLQQRMKGQNKKGLSIHYLSTTFADEVKVYNRKINTAIIEVGWKWSWELSECTDKVETTNNINSTKIAIYNLEDLSSANLKALCSDVGNAFVTADTKEKVYCVVGLEFGQEQVGQVIIIRKALYGLASSSACFHAHFADILRSFGFRPTRFDQDVWIRLANDKSHYEYICTHVNYFCIFVQEPQPIMDQLKSIFTIKSEGPPEYYLGNNYKQDKKGRWCIGCCTYIKESEARVEALLGKLLPKHDVPMTPGDHPELDDSELLGDEQHTEYQMLIGMLNWIVVIGRIDIAFAISSLSHFVTCPRKGHLEWAYYVFGYLKKSLKSVSE